MKRIQTAARYAGLLAFVLLISVAVCVSHVYAEAYIGGQFGMALPSIGGGLKRVEVDTVFLPGTTHSDLALADSFMWGAKAGYYFKSTRWFGLEAEFFSTSPHVKEQIHSFSHPSVGTISSGSPLQGAHLLVRTMAPLNLMFRYHKTRLQPYIGVGPGILFARIKGEGLTPDSPASTSDNGRLGVNAKIGFEYFMTRHITAFGEWKYNYARFQFKENTDIFPFPYGFSGAYQMHLVSFGVSYHF
jgi:opacity protein-like surface antigen